MNSAWVFLGCLAAGPQDPEVFTVDRSTPTPEVSADSSAISAAGSLLALGAAMGWRVDFATKRLESELEQVSLDLSFDGQNPKTIAHLIAATGGADIVLDERAAELGMRSVLHVVTAASAETESGRQRLRRWAMQWYQTFLGDEVKLEPLVREKHLDARMHLGHLLLEQGDVRAAVEVFRHVAEKDSSHAYVPLAMLRSAQSYYDLGDFAAAEKAAREVSRLHPSRPETATATVLLGRTLIRQQRHDEAVAALRASMLSLATTPEIVDIVLLLGEAQMHRERPDHTLEQMRILAEGHDFRNLNQRQWLDYHFLRGFGAEGTGAHQEAMEALEVFLATGPEDPRRGAALVMLGRSYLTLNRPIEARATALQALADQEHMDQAWRKEARILQARTALALGQRDKAFEDLEREVRRDPLETPELIVFLVRSLIDDGRYQKAISAAELLGSVKSKAGDQGRYLHILAMWKQNPRAELLDSFLERAVRIAPQIEDEGLQRQAVELIGQAYGRRGDWDRAVDAYHGVLR